MPSRARAGARAASLHALGWDGAAPDPEAPARDAYALRLVVGRSLYDEGRLVSETPLLQRLVRRARPARQPAATSPASASIPAAR